MPSINPFGSKQAKQMEFVSSGICVSSALSLLESIVDTEVNMFDSSDTDGELEEDVAELNAANEKGFHFPSTEKKSGYDIPSSDYSEVQNIQLQIMLKHPIISGLLSRVRGARYKP